jgi:ribosome-associated translation inhibitor RaiA
MHPFAEDTSSLTIAQIEDKINELSKKYFQTYNSDLQMQISMLLDYYREELQMKIAKERLAQQQDGDDELDNLINIS